MKNLTSSVYTFEKLIDGNYLYVDKTDFIWQLIKEPWGIYFLSRPRRFGKSLTLSTLKAVFQNKKHLFKDLTLENRPYNWKEYPVIHLDLGECPASTAKELDSALQFAVVNAAKEHGINNLCAAAAPLMFLELIRTLKDKDKVVILIDEYDKPILDNISSDNIEEIRRVLEDFYSMVKATEPYQRFVFMTGVSKFYKVSVFSKLNNLTDLSMNSRFAEMLGYTQKEFESNFAEHIEHVCREQKMDKTELLTKLKLWYDGYKFHQNAEPVYNPVSIGKFFESGGEFKNFWFETGTPRFLIDLLKQGDYDLPSLEHLELDETGFSAYEIGRIAVEPLLFQTGYVTLTGYNPETRLYTLGYPNLEVKHAFMRHLMDVFSPVRKELAASHIVKLMQAVKAGAIDDFMSQMRIFFANVPSSITLKNEKYYQTVFYLTLKLVGIYIDAEVTTEVGRIDTVLQTTDHIFVIEFKLHGSADTALRQIKNKKYYEKYLNSGKKITLIGAAFDAKTRNIGHWKTEEI
jgi:hypothetical protein